MTTDKRVLHPLIVIPARGGSKGIPGKNIKPLCGKPLICHSIDHARAIVSDEDICISTDAPEIRAVAEGYGLEIHFLRPAELASDNAPTDLTLRHAWCYYRDILHRRYNTLILLQATSPLRTPDDIRAAMDIYASTSHIPDMVVTVKPADANPYYDIYETDEQTGLRISKGDGQYTRRQDAPQVWQLNGAVYVINPEALMTKRMSDFTTMIPSIMPREHSIDLDTPADWNMAEYLMKS